MGLVAHLQNSLKFQNAHCAISFRNSKKPASLPSAATLKFDFAYPLRLFKRTSPNSRLMASMLVPAIYVRPILLRHNYKMLTCEEPRYSALPLTVLDWKTQI